MTVQWNDVKLGLPPYEGRYIVYKHFPYTNTHEVGVEIFKATFKIDYTTDHNQMMYKKFKFTKTGSEPQIVKAWMFIPENPILPPDMNKILEKKVLNA